MKNDENYDLSQEEIQSLAEEYDMKKEEVQEMAKNLKSFANQDKLSIPNNDSEKFSAKQYKANALEDEEKLKDIMNIYYGRVECLK